jgi:hypothetical protein
MAIANGGIEGLDGSCWVQNCYVMVEVWSWMRWRLCFISCCMDMACRTMFPSTPNTCYHLLVSLVIGDLQ